MEDLIRRSDAIAILEDLQKDHLQFCLIPFRQAIERVQALPSADRPQGEWDDKGYCTNCGKHAPYWSMATTYYKSNYCPNCGARMKGADDERM